MMKELTCLMSHSCAVCVMRTTLAVESRCRVLPYLWSACCRARLWHSSTCDQSLCPSGSITRLLPSYESHSSALCVYVHLAVLLPWISKSALHSSAPASFIHTVMYSKIPFFGVLCSIPLCIYSIFPPSICTQASWLPRNFLVYDMLTLSPASLKSGLSGPYRLCWGN